MHGRDTKILTSEPYCEVRTGVIIWSRRLTARTRGFHPTSRSSTLLETTIFSCGSLLTQDAPRPRGNAGANPVLPLQTLPSSSTRAESDGARRSTSAPHGGKGFFVLEKRESSCHPKAQDRCLPSSLCGFESRQLHQIFVGQSRADRGTANSSGLEPGICGFDSHSAHQPPTSPAGRSYADFV